MTPSTQLVRFTPLMESGRGSLRQSQPTADGRRVYKDVTIIKAGLGNQRDRNYYPPETLQRQVESGAFNGLRAYADHQDSLSEEVQPERTIRDMVGIYNRPRWVKEGKNGGRIVADLHLFRSSKWLADTVDDLIDLGHADRIGLSINGRGKTVERQLQLEEAADPINVNWVEDFIALRSADVVTEAGAGGGFQQLLESARGTSRKETDMKRLTEQQQKAIKAATDANDIPKLTALMQECGLSAKAKPAVAAPVEEADPDVEPEATDAEVLDETAQAIKDGADTREADDDDPDADDPDAGDDVEESDDDDPDTADEDGDNGEGETREAHALPKGAGVIVKGRPGGKHGGAIKGMAAKNFGGGSFVRPGSQKSGLQKGRKFGEGEAAELFRQNEKLKEDNARLSTQLRIRTTTDRARNLLRESAIPGKLQPEILHLMVGKSEAEMRNIVRYHERMVETAIEEAAAGNGFERVEGAGSRFRESSHGGSDTASMANMLDGLPLK